MTISKKYPYDIVHKRNCTEANNVCRAIDKKWFKYFEERKLEQYKKTLKQKLFNWLRKKLGGI